MSTTTHLITLVTIECANCRMTFGISAAFQEDRRRDHGTFYCPRGHGNVYYAKSDEEKLQDELKVERARVVSEQARTAAARELAHRHKQDADHFKASRNAMKGQITKIKKRVAHGVCPCCTRTFQNLQRHMENQHPDFVATESSTEKSESEKPTGGLSS